ncbi:hypothetical protein LTR95_014939 [Oleoguttula sp. CCFEE 5521]
MVRQPSKHPPAVLPLFSDDDHDAREDDGGDAFVPPRREPIVPNTVARATGRKTNNSLAALLNNAKDSVAVSLEAGAQRDKRRTLGAQRRSSKADGRHSSGTLHSQDPDARSDADAKTERPDKDDSDEDGSVSGSERVRESDKVERAFHRASTGSLIVVRPRRAVYSPEGTEHGVTQTSKPPHKARIQSRASSSGAGEAAVSDIEGDSDVEEEIPHSPLNPTSEDDWSDYMPSARAPTATAPQRKQAIDHFTNRLSRDKGSRTTQLHRSTRIMSSPKELATTYFQDLAPRNAKVNAVAQMKAQARQVVQVDEHSDSSSGNSEDHSRVDSEEETMKKALPRSVRDPRKTKSRRQRAEDDVESQDEEDDSPRSTRNQMPLSDDENELGAGRHQPKRQAKPNKKPKVPLKTASLSRSEESPGTVPRENSPSISITASPEQHCAPPKASDPDPATVLRVLKRLRNVTEYLDLWTYRCEILADEAKYQGEQQEESEALHRLMEQARRNWQAVSHDRIERLEMMRHLSPHEVMLCKDWRELLAPVTLFQEIDVDNQEQEVEELHD